MNNIPDGIQDPNCLFYPNFPKVMDPRMAGGMPYPMSGQGMFYPGMGNPLSPIENSKFMYPPQTPLIDHSMMLNRERQRGVGPIKQEDYFVGIRNYYRSNFFPFTDDLLKDLVDQIDMYIQILIQTLLTTKDMNHQYKLYSLFYDFTMKKEAILKPLKLPKFKVPFVNPDLAAGKEPGDALTIQPQVSFYQSPLLEYATDIANKTGQ